MKHNGSATYQRFPMRDGLTALQAGASVIALGKAIYDLPTLTFEGELDEFWTKSAAPDPARLDTFLSALGTIQTPGGFDGEGAKVGADNVAAMILSPRPF